MDLENLRGKRVLVTGGAGFVGASVVRRLVELGAQVGVLDNLETGRHEDVAPGAQFVAGLVEDLPLVEFSGESYCRAFYESYELPTSVVRYSNVCGPGQSARNPYCGVIGKFIEAARQVPA